MCELVAGFARLHMSSLTWQGCSIAKAFCQEMPGCHKTFRKDSSVLETTTAQHTPGHIKLIQGIALMPCLFIFLQLSFFFLATCFLFPFSSLSHGYLDTAHMFLFPPYSWFCSPPLQQIASITIALFCLHCSPFSLVTWTINLFLSLVSKLCCFITSFDFLFFLEK